jgi:imidazoleglycerol-phosphate dehydratase / histidinol-phosphatase
MNITMQKILFLDRDGVLINEPADDPQIDSFEKLKFTKGLFTNLAEIATKLDYSLVMVTNQDGLGTDSFPEKDFWPVHNMVINTLASEGVEFDEVCIDRSFEEDNSPNRKPRTGMLTKYMSGKYDLENSFVIGDRLTDMQLAKNLGCKGIRINGRQEITSDLKDVVALDTNDWSSIKSFLFKIDRKAKAIRNTSETKLKGSINLDGTGIAEIQTGLGFFDHMLDQIAKHASIDLFLSSEGDLHIDEHHTVEDTAIVLGQLFHEALGKKAGIKRYGFSLPMDEAKAEVLLDFGGRPWIVWDVNFKREMIGDVATELFYHFFKSFSDHAKCNLNISAKADNEHHLIESIFKAFAKAIKEAKSRTGSTDIPSTKGSL